MNIKRVLLSFILAITLMVQPFTVSAEENEAMKAPDPAEEHVTEEESYALVPDTNKVEGWPEGPSVYAESAILMDMDTGAVLYAKQADKPQYPASITKFMTALVAMENASMDDKVTFTESSVDFLEEGDAYIGMRPGEVISMDDALHAVLLASANEVSHAVAESVGALLGGDYNTFIEKMNTRAKEIGCTNSHWVNANGLHDDQHFTTAHDMAVIAAALYRQEEFHKIMSRLDYTIPPTNLESESRTFQQNHKMLWKDAQYSYEYCTGGKTGYTDQAMTTLVTVAEKDGRRLAAVVLYDHGPKAYTDTRAMFDYGFDQFRQLSAAKSDTCPEIQSFDDENAYVTVPEGVKFENLKKKIKSTDTGVFGGKVYYTYKGQTVGIFDVTLTEKGQKEIIKLDKCGNTEGVTKEKSSHAGLLLKILLVLLILILVIGLTLLGTAVYRVRKIRKEKALKAEKARKHRREKEFEFDDDHQDDDFE